MSDYTKTRQEHPPAYPVDGRSNEEELTRLQIQDTLTTQAMGGVLTEQADPMRFQRVLDVGCGTGGWLIELAKAYPTATHLQGIDINNMLLAHAEEEAEKEQLKARVTFQTMDALRRLEFPDDSFSLVNQRLGSSYLRTWDWPRLLQEFERVCRPGGVIRITEADLAVESNSQALTQLFHLLCEAFYNAGHFFSLQSRGVADATQELLSKAGVQDVQVHIYNTTHHAGTLQAQYFLDDMRRLFRTIMPFLRKWIRLPASYEEIYTEAIADVQSPLFTATGSISTAWGYKARPHKSA